MSTVSLDNRPTKKDNCPCSYVLSVKQSRAHQSSIERHRHNIREIFQGGCLFVSHQPKVNYFTLFCQISPASYWSKGLLVQFQSIKCWIFDNLCHDFQLAFPLSKIAKLGRSFGLFTFRFLKSQYHYQNCRWNRKILRYDFGISNLTLLMLSRGI